MEGSVFSARSHGHGYKQTHKEQPATIQREIVLNSSENKARKENFWQMVKVFHKRRYRVGPLKLGAVMRIKDEIVARRVSRESQRS